MIWFVPVLACAAIDWIAVARGNKRLEYVTKPLTLALLIAVAIGIGVDQQGDLRAIGLIAALVFSLAGDVFLMLEKDRFIAGLASFLLAHVAYIVVFAAEVSLSLSWAVATVVLVVIGFRNGTRILEGLRSSGRTAFVPPVLAYMVVITTMVATVLATDIWWAMFGAILFYVSDTLIGWSRFVEPLPRGPVTIMVTYHLGQIGLVAGALGL